jgi:hypothetical protein
MMRISLFQTLVVGVLFLSSTAFAQINPNSSTTNWVPILYGTNSIPDPSGDQQASGAELDIVGNQLEPSLYMQYNSGYLGFRLRLGADTGQPGFQNCAFIGLDLNGTIDLFIGVDNQGSHDQLGIWFPGSGLNTSPSTTAIANSPFLTYAETSANYSFTAINATINPGATSFDLNGDGKTDQFLTFFVPFADVASALATQNIIFTTNSPMNLVAATSTQPNSLNADLNGVNGGTSSSQTWAQLGANSLTYNPDGTSPVPEPVSGTLCSVLGGMALLQLVVMRRRY